MLLCHVEVAEPRTVCERRIVDGHRSRRLGRARWRLARAARPATIHISSTTSATVSQRPPSYSHVPSQTMIIKRWPFRVQPHHQARSRSPVGVQGRGRIEGSFQQPNTAGLITTTSAPGGPGMPTPPFSDRACWSANRSVRWRVFPILGETRGGAGGYVCRRRGP